MNTHKGVDKYRMEIELAGFDLDLIDLIESCGHVYAGYYDLREFGDGYLGGDDQANNSNKPVILGSMAPNIRRKLFPIYQSRLTNLVSSLAYVSKTATFGKGITIQHRSTIMNATIGDGVQINIGATVHHECTIGDFVTLAPQSLVLGRVRVGIGAYVGAGAIIREECTIGENAFVGMGAVVVKNIPPNATVMGVPAMVKREPWKISDK
jgi:sugar O-acyltransferase (sialic acid O-acetyltransferase NeuD family)